MSNYLITVKKGTDRIIPVFSEYGFYGQIRAIKGKYDQIRVGG